MSIYIKGLALLLVASATGSGYFLYKELKANPVVVNSAPDEEIVVMRTNGGLLEVSYIKATEIFEKSTIHTLTPFFEVGKTKSQIRVPVVYRYYVELAPEWRFLRKGSEYIVIAPAAKPTLPVAMDTARLESNASGTWSIFTGQEAIDDLQKALTATMSERAAQKKYMELQREAARQTVSEFVRKWVIKERPTDGLNYKVKVLFEDETVISVAKAGFSEIPLSLIGNKEKLQ